jgi:hypothetical protein
MFWKYIPPPWTQNKPITLAKGVQPKDSIRTGRTPEETIQMIGTAGAKVPQQVTVDLGVADIEISDYGQRISYTGRGERTNVGDRIQSNTVGMSIEGSESVLKPLKRGINRPTLQKTPPARKAAKKRRSEFDFSDLTSLKGMRY